MLVLFFSLTLISIAFFLHLIVWKIKIPQKQTGALLKIFFVTLITGLFVLYLLNYFLDLPPFLVPVTFLDYLHIALFFISLTLGYITTYSALEVDSPSLVMVMLIHNAGEKGLDKEHFEKKVVSDDHLVKPRISDLARDGLAFMEEDKYKLTVRGAFVASIFIFYRRLLNKGKGG